MKARRRLSFLVILLLASLPAGAATSFYRSNDFGMQLEPLPKWRRDESTWILEVTTTAGGEVRRLLQDGKEVRRWEITPAADSRREERELDHGVLVTRRIFSPTGSLLEEDRYEKGALLQKSLYTYASSRLVKVRVVSADGSAVYTDEYRYTSRGSLREVRRTGGKDGPRVSWFVEGSSGLSEERERSGEDLYIARYDTHGRIAERETRSGKDLVSREEFSYRPDTGKPGGGDLLLSSVETRPADGRTISRTYDSEGRLQTETVSRAGKVTEETSYARDDKGRVTRKIRRSAAGLEEWRYALDDKGKTVREEFFRRGSLEKITLYGPNDTRTEEMYQGGALFLKVYYEGERRVREEVYVDGKIVRERTSFE